ncbi:hypothetical protein soil367_14835 [Hydrocarboniclastica marina]|uniref:Uncharacterized protein n=2 Tax=Hydrocarboniclastica marina TaxID=2259620 RepID=A0A4P7XJ42_9ALTE|nr:hypothetical protein soil367_14835 [Hydrocarboniclastica marina]
MEHGCMTRRKRVGLAVLAIVLLLVVAALGLQAHLRSSLRQVGIEELHWRDLTLSLRKVELDAAGFVLVQPERRVRVAAEQLTLSWSWRAFRLKVDHLAAERLTVSWDGAPPPAQTPQAAPYSYPSLEIAQSPAFWMPRSIRVADLQVTLPCKGGRCELKGSLQATRSGPASIWPAEAEVQLDVNGHEVLVAAEIEQSSGGESAGKPGSQGKAIPAGLSLSAAITAGGKKYIQLRTEYLPDEGEGGRAVHWTGSLTMPRLPDAGAVASWLRQWRPVPELKLATQPEPDSAAISADWTFKGQVEGEMTRLVSGDVSVVGRINEAWSVPGMAAVRGDLGVAMALARESWQVKHVNADLTFTEPASWVESVPGILRPRSLVLRIRPGQQAKPAHADSEPPTQERVTLDVSVRGKGATAFDIDADLALPTADSRTVQLEDVRVRLDFPRLEAGGWIFRGARADLRGRGEAGVEGLSLELSPGAKLLLDYVDNPEGARPFWADGLAADLAETTLSADYDLTEPALSSLRLAGPVTIDAVRLRHDFLKTQPWHFDGTVALDLDRLTLEGELEAESGAAPGLSLAYDFGDAFILDAGLELTGAKASHVLAGTLSRWPDVLSFSAGALDARFRTEMISGAPADIEGQLGFAALSGQYGQVDWSGLGGGLAFSLSGETVYLQSHDLKLDQLNPGVPIENIVLDAAYRASPANFQEGVLHLRRAAAQVLGGSVQVEPNAWSVAERPLLMIVTFDGVDLSRIMALYPTEGVSGTGQLRGRVPVRIGEHGISVEGGVLSSPGGGVLKLPADRFRSLTPENPAMDLVADAVANFHYSVLRSSVNYDRSGQLMLDLHLEGQNPEVRDGYPVVLNVNLEEDIPALIHSLRLSDRVNRAVTDRVLNRVEKREGQSR